MISVIKSLQYDDRFEKRGFKNVTKNNFNYLNKTVIIITAKQLFIKTNEKNHTTIDRSSQHLRLPHTFFQKKKKTSKRLLGQTTRALNKA